MKRMSLGQLYERLGKIVTELGPVVSENMEVVVPSNELVGITGVEISPDNEYAILTPAHPLLSERLL